MDSPYAPGAGLVSPLLAGRETEYCTSLDMAGASLTLVKLDEEIAALLDAPAEAAIRIF